MNSQHRYRALWGLAAGVALAFFAGSPLVAQAGTVEGTVVDENQQPIGGAQVSIVDSQRGTITAGDGTFRITNVASGTREVRVQRIGYRSQTQTVEVAPGATVAANFSLQQAVLDLEAVVVTGVAGETSRAKLPFVVDQLRMEDLPVPAVSAGGAIQGKVAGAVVVSGSGRPGSGQSILLRGPTSINAAGRSQEPLYIVDGVILSGSFVDFDALEIENIEVVKGAAAASLYGSRAANGVVQITTRRGRNVAEGDTRFTVRSEIGRNQLPGTIATAQYHPYAMQDGRFVGEGGVLFDYDEPGSLQFAPWTSFQVNQWPGQTYDHMAQFFNPGTFGQHSLSMEGRMGQTNYLVSLSNLRESGVISGQEGFNRNNFRINLDHGLFENLTVGATAFFSRSDADQFTEAQGNPIFALTFIPPVVDLSQRTDAGWPEPWPDHRGEEMNPLHQVEVRDFHDGRERFLGSGTLRYHPVSWFSVDGSLSYDRLSVNRENFYPRGYGMPGDGRAPNRASTQNQGWLRLDNIVQDAINAHVSGTFRERFGDLATTAQLRYLFEDQSYESFYGQGQNLSVAGIPRLGVTDPQSRVVSSYGETIRSEGIYLLTNFDFRDRYILDAQVRRDGSSLFGPDDRWHTYYRVAGAYRISEEPFFNLPAINEFKFRYAIGTAGNKPSFAAQYETFSVAGGAPTPVTLGNRELRPEFATEQEMGVDVSFLDRFDLTLTYAMSTIEDQILPIPLPATAGYGQQWQNAGTLESNTWEASLGGTVIDRGNFSYNARVLFDRTRQEITQLDAPCHTYGLPASNPQGFEAAFYACPGEAIGTFYGIRWATDVSQLGEGANPDYFQVDNYGYLVYVGPNATWRDGRSQNLWGTTHEHAGRVYQWGTPIQELNEDGLAFHRIGRTTPDFSWSFANTVRLGGLSIYGLLDASHGFDVYNRGRQWAMRDRMAAEMDQAGIPEDEQKPVGYFNPGLYAVNNLSSHFVEDGSFVKLRELSLGYTFPGDRLAALGVPGVDRISLNLTGRNLLTWTDYTGFDPEVGFTGGQAGSAALNRIDSYQYPNFRTFTLGVELGF